jgi:hypothetical protein
VKTYCETSPIQAGLVKILPGTNALAYLEREIKAFFKFAAGSTQA